MANERASLILRIGTDPVVRLWGGAQSFQAPSTDPVDPNGVYGPLAGGDKPEIGAIPAMQQLVGGAAQALDFTFTGVDEVSRDWVDNGSAEGAVMNLGLVIFGSDWSQAEDIWWMWKGIVATATATGGVDSSVVTLTVESAPSYRARAGLKMFTDASHKVDHPTDDFFKNVGTNRRVRTIEWGSSGRTGTLW
jgi:hypothetical protein